MRRAIAVTLVALMTAVACGGGKTVDVTVTEPVDVADSAEVRGLSPADLSAASRAADLMIVQMGDETAALAAALLAADRGYGVAQIVDAGTAGRMAANGVLSATDGSPLVPEFEAPALLVDDLTGTGDGPPGFRAQPQRKTLSQVMDSMNESLGDARGSLVSLLILLANGYSLDQVLLAVLSDGSVGPQGQLLDGSDAFIRPARDQNIVWAEVLDDRIPLPDSVPAAGAEVDFDAVVDEATEPADDREPSYAELIDMAVGQYVVGPELANDLWSRADDVSAVHVGTGVMVVSPDGTVSGELAYEVTTTTETSDGPVTHVWGVDYTFPGATLEVLDDGLTFTTMATLAASDGGEVYGTWETAAAGLLDPAIGQLVVRGLVVAESIDTVRFERTAE